jgi:hypothetical protein
VFLVYLAKKPIKRSDNKKYAWYDLCGSKVKKWCWCRFNIFFSRIKKRKYKADIYARWGNKGLSWVRRKLNLRKDGNYQMERTKRWFRRPLYKTYQTWHKIWKIWKLDVLKTKETQANKK